MKQVLLINLPGQSIRKSEEHCGIAFLHAFLKAKGVHSTILDAFALSMTIDECKQAVKDWLASKECITYIGIAPYVTSYNEFVLIGSYIKDISKNCYILAGGHFATLNKEYLLHNLNWLDGIIVGEGELTLYDVICSNNINIPGFYCRKFEDSFVKRERIANLDILPFQTRYLNEEQLKGQPYSITTSRGCYGHCSFCSIDSFYQYNSVKVKQTYRSAQSVSEEIHELVDKYGASSFKIVDDNFFRDYSDDFLEELVNLLSDVNVTFRLSARPNDITRNRARLLKELGVRIVGIGVESADEESLKIFNKGLGIDSSEKAIALLKEQNIACLANFIMFNPIIDLEGIEKNCKFVKEHQGDSIFHRINSHLWLRSTDPITVKLHMMGLCENKGFPYVIYKYKHKEIELLKKLYDRWCSNNMKLYYSYADVLMANGIVGYEDIYMKYKMLLSDDIYVLEKLISSVKKNVNYDGCVRIVDRLIKERY